MSLAVDRCPAHKPAVPARLDDAARDLAADPKNLRMARKIAARSAARHGIPIDDAEGAAFLGLADAARHYRPEMGFKFSTYAPRRIVGAIADAAREWRPGKRTRADVFVGSLFEAAGFEKNADGGGISLARIDLLVADEDAPESALDSSDMIEALIRLLPPGYQQPMRLICTRSDLQTCAAAGRELGYSESRISQIRIDSVAMIREALAARGIHSRADLGAIER